MLKRRCQAAVESALARQAAVALIGPRQAGKTTLALMIAETRPSIYLDLESAQDRAKLSDPELYFAQHPDELIILDEIHRAPDIFQTLRVVIDRSRRKGKRTGLFLLLGSAAIDLLRQSGETLAGRIEYVDMGPLDALEVNADSAAQEQLWLRGGFPDSYLAASDEDSFRLRQSFIRTYLERDVPQFGPRIPSETLQRLWTMLAHNQSGLLNASRLATSLELSSPTVTRYIDLLVDLLLVRRLPPFHANAGKRLVKSPKVYVRDSGLVHALLGLRTFDDLLGHPVSGASWEGFVLESLLSAAPSSATASFYRTTAGAEMDLVLELGGRAGRWAIEIKRGLAPTLTKGFHMARKDLAPTKTFVVYSGTERYPLAEGVEAIGHVALAQELARSHRR
ncbi:MAG: ATP-binding protein [Steroidobacteraceae bacterium]|nr:ATP-binding protein [Steroidobacteraceae bacterium]